MNTLKVIAHIHTDFPEKFGVPRQSGLIKTLKGRIVFEPEFRSPDAVKGLERFTYLWLLWEFEGVNNDTFNATVRPPRLGGNETMGVFATRSPFRPNPIGLSSVKLEAIEYTGNGPEIIVSGIDCRDNTPIFDIKPYLGYVDAHPDASDGFAGDVKENYLNVNIDEELLVKSGFPTECEDTLRQILASNPRPCYHNDPKRIYGLYYKDFNIKFCVEEDLLTVLSVEKS